MEVYKCVLYFQHVTKPIHRVSLYMILPCVFVKVMIAAASKTIKIIPKIPTPSNNFEYHAERYTVGLISSLGATNSFIDEVVTREPSILRMICLEYCADCH